MLFNYDLEILERWILDHRGTTIRSLSVSLFHIVSGKIKDPTLLEELATFEGLAFEGATIKVTLVPYFNKNSSLFEEWVKKHDPNFIPGKMLKDPPNLDRGSLVARKTYIITATTSVTIPLLMALLTFPGLVSEVHYPIPPDRM